MSEFFERLTSMGQAAAARLKVRSALNALLYMFALALGPACFLLTRDDALAKHVGVVLILVPLILLGIGFLYFMLKDPTKLRSEEYEIKKMALELIEEKGRKIPIEGTAIVAIANPERPFIGDGGRHG